MDRKDILAKLSRAHDEIEAVVDGLTTGDQTRIGWTRLLAHNINNHLTSVFFIIERFVQSGNTSAEQAIYVDSLKSVAERIQETMGRLMTVAQFDSLVKVAPVDIRETVAEAARRAAGYAELKSIRVDTVLGVPTGVLVDADKVALIEGLLNLIGNAIKYSPSGKVVRISLVPAGTSVECRVQDQGPGIPRDEQAKLFKLGSVLSTRPTGGEPQTGIGLALTAELVRAMSGAVWCESEPGHGAMFGLRLPVRPAAKT